MRISNNLKLLQVIDSLLLTSLLAILTGLIAFSVMGIFDSTHQLELNSHSLVTHLTLDSKSYHPELTKSLLLNVLQNTHAVEQSYNS